MSLFDIFSGKKEKIPDVCNEHEKLYAPLSGTIISIDQIPDEVFSKGILGEGCGIEPEDNEVVAPVSGIISAIADTKHAIGITAANGAELLIHVGMDTVDMNGAGFHLNVKVGQKVSCGQLLLTFDADRIKAAGHPMTTAFIVTNSDEFSKIIMTTGIRVKKSEKIGELQKK
jgi:PTS system, glucose subfamily, IIA component